MRFINPLIIFLLFGCASKPVLFPNEKYKNVGKEQANTDIDTCLKDADEFLKSSKGKQILKGTAKGSVFGSIMGGVTGILTGDILEGVAAGAAIGGVGGATGEALSPDRLKQSYTNACLQKQGYRVLGWD